jgi:hypothetical protein
MSRARKIVGLVSAIVIAACVDLSAPKGTPASISQLQLPAFFVVQGDTMRDTLGRALPPTIIAYDAKGGVLTSFGSTFFITDSAQQLHFSAIDSALVASGVNDTAGAVVHVVGQIASLQTAVQTVYVTVRPDTLERSDATVLNDTLPRVSEDSASSIRTVAISMVVHGANARPVPGVFVRFTLESSPAGKGSAPVAYLTDDANRVYLAGTSAPDTADASGVVARTLVVNSFMAPAPASALIGDTLVVIVTAKYKNTPLQGSPFRVLVPIVSPSFGTP